MTPTNVVDRYCSVWNESRRDEKLKMLALIWKQDATYIDPRAHVKGIEELINHIEKIQLSRPGSTVRRTSPVDVHHNIGRFNWQLTEADGAILIEGLDVVYFNQEMSKIENIIGFFGRLKTEITE